MPALIIHLSDIHIRSREDRVHSATGAIVACARPFLPRASHVFLVVSGDIAFSGKTDQYSAATDLLEGIKAGLEAEIALPIAIIIAPGNHDCDLEANTQVRNLCIDGLVRDPRLQVDNAVIDECTSVQSAFFAFRTALESPALPGSDKLWRSYEFSVDGWSVIFDCLNLSWVSQLHDEPGKLSFPTERYGHCKTAGKQLRVAVYHHPAHWIAQQAFRPFRAFLRGLAGVVMSGHEHCSNAGLVDDTEAGRGVFIEGSALQEGGSLDGSGLNIIELDLTGNQVSVMPHSWIHDAFVPVPRLAWKTDSNALRCQASAFPLTEMLRERLDDPGAKFAHPDRQDLVLDDVFVYPDMRAVSTNSRDSPTTESTSILCDLANLAGGVFLEGEEKAGRTSLLYRLFRHFHEQGLVPLLVAGRDLKRSSGSDIDKCIDRAVGWQYGADHVVAFQQLPSERRVLLLDDFDDSPIKATASRVQALEELAKRFNYYVVSVSDLFEVRELTCGRGSSLIDKCDHYKLQQFGYVRRQELIERWVSLGTQSVVSDEDRIARCDRAERLIDTVMERTLVPAHPLYLLTFLQSLEAGQLADLKESELGHYYQFLLTAALGQAGVSVQRLTEHFTYASHLAFAFHTSGRREMSEADLRMFNEEFSSKWHTVDFTERIATLVEARVLSRHGLDYAFRYPYVYYYLKSHYMAQHLADPAVCDHIAQCCSHLYVRDNAHTVLFLAHHTNDEFLLDSIAKTLNGQFADLAPVVFGGDTKGIGGIISGAPALSYAGGDPIENRRRRNEARDEHAHHEDVLADAEETASELSLIARLTMLFKAVEILGQILKTQYSRISRERKRVLLADLFRGPLRALRSFYDLLERDPDALAMHIEAGLRKDSERHGNARDREKAARRAASWLVQFVSYGFIMRAVQAASAESLYEDVAATIAEDGTSAFKLVQLGIHLDAQRDLPRVLVETTNAAVSNDMLAERVMRLMVINRLYMFKTKERDMQWVSEKLDISVKAQRQISYIKAKHRLK